MGKDKETSKKNYILISVFIAIIIITLIITFSVKTYYANKEYTEYDILSQQDADSSFGGNYLRYGDYLLRYSNDGASYFTPSGEVWNQAYEMKAPIADVCNNYAAVADQGSNEIYIFNKDGTQGTVHMSYAIAKVKVAGNGVVASILQNDGENYIEIRDEQDNQLVIKKTALEKTGYPLDFDISEDGKKMVVSYVCVTGTAVQSKVLFYNFDEIGEDKVDNMVGGFNQYETTMVPTVAFTDKNTSIAFGDNLFSIYTVPEIPTLSFEDHVKQEIQKVFYSSKYLGMVQYNNAEEKPYQAVVYDLSGNKVFEYQYNEDFDNVKLDGENLVLYGSTHCMVVSFKNIVKFDEEFPEKIIDIFSTNKAYQYILITQSDTKMIKLK